MTIIRDRLIARIEFKAADCWVGAFWKTSHVTLDGGPAPFVTDVWVCLLPMLPLHFQWFHRTVIPFAN